MIREQPVHDPPDRIVVEHLERGPTDRHDVEILAVTHHDVVDVGLAPDRLCQPRLVVQPEQHGRLGVDVVAVDEDRPPTARREGGREVGRGLACPVARLGTDQQQAADGRLGVDEGDLGRHDAVRGRHPRRRQ